MDIEREFTKRKILKISAGMFDLTLCKAKVISERTGKKKEIVNPPSQGYIHAATKLKDSLYAVFGPYEGHPDQTMHSYSFKTNGWRHWADCGLPGNRDSFGLTTLQTEIYMFGGSNLDEQFGDTHVFSTFTSTWRTLEGEGPSPRDPMVFTGVGGQFILLYGGVDIQKSLIYDDAYILVDGKWRKLAVKDAPPNLVGANSAVFEDEIYVFGGESQQQGAKPVSNTTLYKLKVNANALTVEFIAVVLANEIRPCPRTAHSMIGINAGNFMMVGGIGLEGSNKNQILRDLWLFNADELRWSRIDPVNGPLRGFCESWLCLHTNKIFILGGLAERLDTWNEQIALIEFGEDEIIRNEICSNCQQRAQIREREEKAFPKSIVVSTGFFYNVSLEYRHPFQAINALHQCAAFMGASSFHFSIAKGLTENQFIEIEWQGRPLTRPEFEKLICHSSSLDEEFSKFASILKIASFRLGKTLLFINASEKERKVFLLSADSKVCPEFDETYSFFTYLQNVERGMIESHEGRSHRKVILNMLRSRLTNPEQALSFKNGTLLLIFQKNILVTSEKAYYYELISSSNDDMTVFRSSKKLQFLSQLGYPISKEPELSLKAYLSILSRGSLDPKFLINSGQEQAQAISYQQRLNYLEEQGKISQIELVKGGEGFEYEAKLYQAEQTDVFEDNLGVLVYLKGKLVNRLDYNFGDLFKQAFYKTKFKTATTIFPHLGVIDIKSGLELNYLGTWFRKQRNYYLLIENVRDAMRKGKLDKIQRRLKLGAGEGQQRKQAKQAKQTIN